MLLRLCVNHVLLFCGEILAEILGKIRKMFRRVLAVLFLLCAIVFLAACQKEVVPTAEASLPPPTATPIPSATIDWFPKTATPVREASPTPVQSEITRIAVTDEDLIAKDDFSDESLWQIESSDAGTIAYGEKMLTLAVAGGRQILTSLSAHQLPSDFYLEIDLDALMCSAGDQYGLILWNNSQAGTFRLWLNCDGKIKLDRVLPSGVSQLVNWQPGRKLQPGSPANNRLAILAKEGVLEVYVAETLQFSYELHARPEGVLGVIAQTGGELPMTIRVSDLQIMFP